MTYKGEDRQTMKDSRYPQKSEHDSSKLRFERQLSSTVTVWRLWHGGEQSPERFVYLFSHTNMWGEKRSVFEDQIRNRWMKKETEILRLKVYSNSNHGSVAGLYCRSSFTSATFEHINYPAYFITHYGWIVNKVLINVAQVHISYRSFMKQLFLKLYCACGYM